MKTSTAKAKGRETENMAVDFFRSWGLVNVERRRLKGNQDEGDITGWPGVCVEVKSGAALSVAQWLRELWTEMRNSRCHTGFVMVRPKGKPDPNDWFAIVPMPVLMALYAETDWLPEIKEGAA